MRWIRKVCLQTGDLSWKLCGRKCAMGRSKKIQMRWKGAWLLKKLKWTWRTMGLWHGEQGGGGMSWGLEGKRKEQTSQVTQEHERSSWRNLKLSHRMTQSAWALQSSIMLISRECIGRGPEMGELTGGCWSSPDRRDGGMEWGWAVGAERRGQ